jgi:glutamyl-tRNA reductase
MSQPTTNNLEGERETINHLATVLMCMFGELERLNYNSPEKETEKQWDKRIKKQNLKYIEAKNYLEDYITDLRKHDMEELIKMLPDKVKPAEKGNVYHLNKKMESGQTLSYTVSQDFVDGFNKCLEVIIEDLKKYYSK